MGEAGVELAELAILFYYKGFEVILREHNIGMRFAWRSWDRETKMNNPNFTMHQKQAHCGTEAFYLPEPFRGGNRNRECSANFLEPLIRNLASLEEVGGTPGTARRVSIRFLSSSPVCIQIAMGGAAPNLGNDVEPLCPVGRGKALRAAQAAKTGFYLEAPAARQVKLAVNFTQWESFPVEMTRMGSGMWGIILPLKPGNYSYRFIIDGQWCEDFQSVKRVTTALAGCAR